jgi:hypothetical protein
MTDEEIAAVFADFRGRHAQRIAWECLAKNFYWLGMAIEDERRPRTSRRL